MKHLPVRTPTVPPATHTNCYRVGRVVVDPASPWLDEQERLATFAAGIDTILLTHHHVDHIGGVEDLRRRTGARVLAHADSRLDFALDGTLTDGDVVDTGDGTLTALHTPGHADGHLCFRHESGAILAGDMVAGVGTIVLIEPEGHLATYLASLERLRGLGGRLYPAHGPDLDAQTATTQYITHRNGRTEQVAAALGGRPLHPSDIARIVYAGIHGVDLDLAAVQVRTHLTFLVERGAAVRLEDGAFARG